MMKMRERGKKSEKKRVCSGQVLSVIDKTVDEMVERDLESEILGINKSKTFF